MRSNLSPSGSVRLLPILALCGLMSSGCDLTMKDVDSFMDPSTIGRWEHTPVVLPILERLDLIDEPRETIPGLSPIMSEDLIPNPTEYVMGAGDTITVSVFELIRPGLETVVTRQVDELGRVRMPVIGEIRAAGLTTRQMEQKITEVLHPAILRDPTVSVLVREAHQKTYSIIGVFGTGTYQLVKNDFRLLDALAMAGISPEDSDTSRIRENLNKVYVIRQIPLHDSVRTGLGAAPEAAAAPAPQGALDPARLLENMARGGPAAQGAGLNPHAGAMEPKAGGEGRFVNLNGKWVWVESSPKKNATAMMEPGAPQVSGLPKPGELMSQRIIEIDAQALARGEAKYNIVVRPGDIIRIPRPGTGQIYIGGEIARGGTYYLPGENKLTLRQLVIAAGGLSELGIPERVDLHRRIGGNREAIVRLNLRAIAEGVQPDIFLKADDTVNVGTNLTATFLATIRNGFRTSYGFGFILDRNFGPEVFGPQLQ